MVLYLYKEPPVVDLEKEIKTVLVSVSILIILKIRPMGSFWPPRTKNQHFWMFLKQFTTTILVPVSVMKIRPGSCSNYLTNYTGTGVKGFLVLITSKTGMYKLVPPNTGRKVPTSQRWDLVKFLKRKTLGEIAGRMLMSHEVRRCGTSFTRSPVGVSRVEQ